MSEWVSIRKESLMNNSNDFQGYKQLGLEHYLISLEANQAHIIKLLKEISVLLRNK